MDVRALGDGGNAEVAEEHFVASVQEHVFRFDVAVDEVLIVGVLQGGSQWGGVGENGRERDLCPFGMFVTQGAVGGVIHDQKGDILAIDAKIKQGNDMGMAQAEGSRLVNKFLELVAPC